MTYMAIFTQRDIFKHMSFKEAMLVESFITHFTRLDIRLVFLKLVKLT